MMKALYASYLVVVFCFSAFRPARGLQCYQCDSHVAMVNCTMVQKKVTCKSGVTECCSLADESGTARGGYKYNYFGKACKGSFPKTPDDVFVYSFSQACCGQSLCNTSSITQASYVLVSCLILAVSKII